MSVVSGPSGAGKSRLLNALVPGLELATAEVSEAVRKGRHTTVAAELHPVPGGSYVVDTPGLREFGLWRIDPPDLPWLFREFRRHAERCEFRDCRHATEPGCAVRAAVERGEIAGERHESYLRLLHEEDKARA